MTSEDMEMELEAYLATHANAAAGDAPPILAEGTHVGEWTVAGFIGRGGSSEVYCASATQGHVALKVLVRDTPAQRARFTHETALLREIAHPAFPRILGEGEVAGHPFFALELLEPMDLPSSDHAVAEYLLAVADGVGRLHAAGLVHRDLKPQNIMRRPSDGRPVIIDLGLAKEFDDSNTPPSDDSLSVADGRRVGVGTPRYAAPEQMSGGAAAPAVDIHSLGVLANECFGGRPPARWARIVRRATSSIPGQRYRDTATFMRAIRMRWLPTWIAISAAILATATLATTVFALRQPKSTNNVPRPETPPPAVAPSPSITPKAVTPQLSPELSLASILEGMTKVPDKAFLISRTECTQAQWKGVMGGNPSKFKGMNSPVENVSYIEVQSFIKRLNAMPQEARHGLVFRLPTMDEWQLAARGGMAESGFGSKADGTAGTAEEMGWHKGNSGRRTHSVGQKTPNAYGVFDMFGNVFEFVSTPPSSLSNGHGVPKGYVTRCGGAYNWDADVVRLDGDRNHDFLHKSMKYPTTGLRLAAEKQP